MCEIEIDDVCEVWNSTWPHARVTHKCCSCGMPISPGEVYLRFFAVCDGSITNLKACAVCGTLWQSFLSAHGGGYDPWSLSQMLVDCISEGDGTTSWGKDYFESIGESKAMRAKMRAVDGQWRTYLAIIKQRRRQSKRLERLAA